MEQVLHLGQALQIIQRFLKQPEMELGIYVFMLKIYTIMKLMNALMLFILIIRHQQSLLKRNI